MMRFVVQLKELARVVGRKHRPIPLALYAAEIVAFENCNPDVIRDVPIMHFGLAVFFEHVDTDCKIIPTAVFSDDRPARLSAEFSHTPSPFLRIASEIFQLLTGYLAPDVPAEIL
jgi:hypothetical protein